MATLLDANVTVSWSEPEGPRQRFIDITFSPSPVTVDAITFKNFYTSSITINHTCSRDASDPLLHQHAKGREPTWQLVVAHIPLMADPHSEDGAQCHHEVSQATHFDESFDHERVTRLRISCKQPSPLWRDYGLQEVRCYGISQPAYLPPRRNLSLTLSQQQLVGTMMEQIIGLRLVTDEVRQAVGSKRVSRKACTGISSKDRAAELDLAPYIVGEWADELHLHAGDIRHPAKKPP